VAESADSDDAVDLVAATRPDAVLLDWLFEGRPRGGLVLASLRRWAPEVPVVVYTAYPDEATSRAAQLGAAYVATKEIGQSAELGGILRKVIDEWQDCLALEQASKAAAGPDRARTAAMARRERARARLSCAPHEPGSRGAEPDQ